MRLEDVKIGMKVVPHSKSVNCGLFSTFKESRQINKMKDAGQKFLYVNKILHDNAISLATELNVSGDMFLASDFEPYIEKTNKQTIELIFNGTTTIALLKGETGIYTKGIARLHHEDTYDKLEGIRIAVGRALGLDIELPKEKTIEDFSDEELLDGLKKRLLPVKKESDTFTNTKNNSFRIKLLENFGSIGKIGEVREACYWENNCVQSQKTDYIHLIDGEHIYKMNSYDAKEGRNFIFI